MAELTADAARRHEPVDLSHLDAQTMGDRALAEEVLSLFAAHALATLARVKAASTIVERREAAHALVGSARGIGAFAVARTAREVERDAESDIDIAPLEAEVDKARHFIARYLERLRI